MNNLHLCCSACILLDIDASKVKYSGLMSDLHSCVACITQGLCTHNIITQRKRRPMRLADSRLKITVRIVTSFTVVLDTLPIWTARDLLCLLQLSLFLLG